MTKDVYTFFCLLKKLLHNSIGMLLAVVIKKLTVFSLNTLHDCFFVHNNFGRIGHMDME